MRHGLLSFGIMVGVQLVASPFVMAADLETIQRRGHLIVAVKDNWRPLGFTDEQGALAGLEIDIAARLAELLFGDASAVVFRPVANQERLPAVLNGEVDIVIAGVAITPARERVVDFSLPYYLDGTALITNDPNIETLADLQTAAIALIEGSDAVSRVHYHLPAASLVGVPSYQAALDAIAAGQVSAAAGDISVLTGWVQEYPDYRILADVISAEPLAVVIPKGTQHRSLRQFINTAIEQWHQDGWLEEQATVWGLP